MKKLIRNLASRSNIFVHCEAGVAYIEFAISITVLLIMFYGSLELTRYILIVQKVEKTIASLTDVLTQALPNTINNTAVSQYLAATGNLMTPYPFGSKGNVILTDISTPLNAATPATIQWQVCGGGTLSVSSKLGSPGNTATLPPTYTMNAGEEVVIGEIYYNFTPMLAQDVIMSAQVYRTAVFKPRYGYGALDNPNNVTSVACP